MLRSAAERYSTVRGQYHPDAWCTAAMYILTPRDVPDRSAALVVTQDVIKNTQSDTVRYAAHPAVRGPAHTAPRQCGSGRVHTHHVGTSKRRR